MEQYIKEKNFCAETDFEKALFSFCSVAVADRCACSFSSRFLENSLSVDHISGFGGSFFFDEPLPIFLSH